jgi:hypothetical protein
MKELPVTMRIVSVQCVDFEWKLRHLEDVESAGLTFGPPLDVDGHAVARISARMYFHRVSGLGAASINLWPRGHHRGWTLREVRDG